MKLMKHRQAIAEFIRAEARPRDKFSHQPRVYELAKALGEGRSFDDDVLYAAAWLHDIGVFVGHRPENPADLAAWDNIAYAVRVVPGLLTRFGFPTERIPAVIEAIRTHLPSGQPTFFEGVLLREADILEQLGAVGILRTVNKVGRDTRYPTHTEALRTLQRNAKELPGLLTLPLARQLARPRVALMTAFLQAANAEMDEPRAAANTEY
jgi:uncharacterized protein